MSTPRPPDDAFEAEVEAIAARPAVDPEAASTLVERARHGMFTRLRRLAPALALVGVIVWSWCALQQLDRPGPAAPPPHVPPRLPTIAPAVDPRPTEPPEEDASALEALIPGVQVPAFLDTEVERLDHGQTTRERLKTAAILARRVTLVNLWATWCEPCNRELPGLRDMFERGRQERDWGDEVRFVTLLVDDASTPETAYRAVQDSLPPDTTFLVDYGLGGGVRPALADSELLAANAGLPISLLFDCQRRVRWHHVGELRAGEFANLAEQIDLLRAERGTAACPPARPRAAEEPARPLPSLRDGPAVASVPVASRPSPLWGECDAPHPLRCGDGCCDRGESCGDCEADCACTAGETCVAAPGQAPRCSPVKARVEP